MDDFYEITLQLSTINKTRAANGCYSMDPNNYDITVGV